MKRILIVLVPLLVVVGNVFAQTGNPSEELARIVERDNAQIPLDFGSQGTATKAFLEDGFYVMVCEINDKKIFYELINSKKFIKKYMMRQLALNDVFIDDAKILLACQKEMKYVYVCKPNGRKTEIILTKKDLKKIIKR